MLYDEPVMGVWPAEKENRGWNGGGNHLSLPWFNYSSLQPYIITNNASTKRAAVQVANISYFVYRNK